MSAVILGALGLVMTGCGDRAGKQVERDQVTTAAACVAHTGPPDACLRFIERVVRVRSLQLTAPAPSEVKASCGAAARTTHLRVVCPPIVPVGGVVADHDLYGPQVVNVSTYSVSINNGQNPGHIHWEFGAIKGPERQLWVFDTSDWDASPPKHPARRIGQHRSLGYLIALYRFPDNDGQLEGHDAAIAREGGISYFVSVHGHHDDDADIAMLLAILLARETR